MALHQTVQAEGLPANIPVSLASGSWSSFWAGVWVLIVLLSWSLLCRIQVVSDWCLAASWSYVSLMSHEVHCVLRTWFGITVFLHRGLPVSRSLPFYQADPRDLQAEFGDRTPSFGVSSRLASVSSTVQGYNKNLRCSPDDWAPTPILVSIMYNMDLGRHLAR